MPKTPYFENEDQEREFWATHSATDYQEDWEPLEEEVEVAIPRAGEELVEVSIKYLEVIKEVAARQGVPYRALIHKWLEERLAKEAPELMR